MLNAGQSKYDENLAIYIAKCAKRLQTQMRSYTLDAFRTTSAICFLCAFKLACDTNGIQDCAVEWLLQFFMKDSSAAAYKTRLCLKPT